MIPQFPPPQVITTVKPVLTSTPVFPIGDCGNNFSTQSIVQDCKLRNTSFEQNIVNLWLGYHGLPQTDAPLIYQYATADVRSQIRALMF